MIVSVPAIAVILGLIAQADSVRKLVASTNDRVFVECQYRLMPVATAEEPARVLLTSELPVSVGGGGLANYSGDLRKASGDKGPALGYRCEINNYTKSTLFNVSVSPRLTFRESVPVPHNEKSRGQGKITLDREWPCTRRPSLRSRLPR